MIGLGYVGLPLAVEFAKHYPVIGFDINQERISGINQGHDSTLEVEDNNLQSVLTKNIPVGTGLYLTNKLDEISDCNVYIVTVPTPVDKNNRPDLTPLIKASESIGKVIKKGDIVIYESTVYPGCTEEDCVPVIERTSGMKMNTDFYAGYSPERINPGDKEHTLITITKVVSGCDDESLDIIAKTYELVVKAGVYRASSIKVAEAAKIIENTQRDVNIALMNELSIIFNRIGINTYDVLEAAGTKWNFLRFYPGLVGGHCIGVDPYYLTFKAKELKYHPQVIDSGRFVNDSMGPYIAKQLVKKLIGAGKNVMNCRILIMGTTFKENVSDIRNSKVADVYNELKSYGVHIDVIDPHASSEEVRKEYGYGLVTSPSGKYDAVVVAVAHKDYINLQEDDFRVLMDEKGILADIKGMYRKRIKALTYWSL